MSLNSLIESTLSPLDVPVYPNTYDGEEDTYIVFNTYNEAPEMNADDEEIITKYFIQVDVFSSGNYLSLVKKVKRLMKDVGFGRMFESETYDTEMKKNRKIIRFNYEPNIGEEI